MTLIRPHMVLIQIPLWGSYLIRGLWSIQVFLDCIPHSIVLGHVLDRRSDQIQFLTWQKKFYIDECQIIPLQLLSLICCHHTKCDPNQDQIIHPYSGLRQSPILSVTSLVNQTIIFTLLTDCTPPFFLSVFTNALPDANSIIAANTNTGTLLRKH